MNFNSYANYPVIDGFLLNTKLRCNLVFKSMALQQWERLRRAGGYKTKAWVIPEDSRVSIPVDDAYETQVKCVPGAAIWGYGFTAPAGSGPFSVQVRDSCTDQPLFQEVIRCDNYFTNPADRQQPLPCLLVISPPGLLTVEICSLQESGPQSQVQLILWGGEPVC